MYEAYWGLREKPFENTPDPRFLFQSDETADVYIRLLYTLKSNRGAALLTGESGCGKTLVIRALLQQLDPERTEIALVNDPGRTAVEFLREVLYQLGEETDAESRPEIVHRIHELLNALHTQGKETIVVIDEGQLMEDPEVLEEIRLLLNFQLNDAFLITLLMVGTEALADKIRNSPLDQRIAARGILKPMGREDVHEYVAHRLDVAGRKEPVFSSAALDLVHDFSDGVPRMVNNICDISLVIGYGRKLDSVDAGWMRRLIQAAEGSRV
jgi:general secretion pathway protein A